MNEKTCCVTGHRDIAKKQIAYVEQELRHQVQIAIKDGYTHFISGFSEGTDLIFASVVAKEKERHSNLFLEAAIPYANRLKIKDDTFQTLLQSCDRVMVVREQYIPSCFMQRNRYMVGASQRVIAVYDGREKGRTLYTMRYAHILKREIYVIEL